MRSLTEDEMTTFFEKLAKFIGSNIKHLIEDTEEPYCFRIQNDRVFYMAERVMKTAISVGRDNLIGMGVCFGKFTKSKKFMLQVTSLEYIAKYAKFKVWVKPSSEMSFLYGNHVLKAGLGRITESTPRNAGVVVLSMSDTPLGFGTTAHSTPECRKLDPTSIVVYHQADIGEYLREEETLL